MSSLVLCPGLLLNRHSIDHALTVARVRDTTCPQSRSSRRRTMPNRRDFFKNVAAATAAAFVGGYGLADAVVAAAQGAAPARRRAMIAGRPVTVIDVHAHTFVPEVSDLVK